MLIFRSAALSVLVLGALGASSGYLNFEGSQVSPVRLSFDGRRLFAVNTPGASLSVFDLTNPNLPNRIAQIPVGLEPVSVNPRTNDEAWVVNQGSDSISVVSVLRGIVTETIYLPDEPADVVFANGFAFVSLGRNNRIAVVNANTRQVVKLIELFGGYPRSMAVSPDGRTVYAAFGFSGNKTTLVQPGLAPPQPPPTNPLLPPAPQVGLIVNYDNPLYNRLFRFTMPDNDVVAIDTNLLAAREYYQGVGTVNLGLGVRPTTGDLFVANTEALNQVRFEPNLRGRFVFNRITRILARTGQVTPFDLNPGVDYNQLPNPGALARALAQPTAVEFEPSGLTFWTAAFGTDRVARVDINGRVVNLIEIGPATGTQVNPVTKRGPRGLAMHGSAQRLYVLNRLSNTITVVNTLLNNILGEFPVGSFDPTPDVIRNGRGFLYDAKLSGNGLSSCASCHVDGDMDHLAWDLGDPGGSMQSVTSGSENFVLHPMKGPMVTQTLKGIRGNDPLHWRGDKPNFQAFNGAFSSLLGGSPLSDEDMDRFTAFVHTMAFMPNPYQNLDRTLPATLTVTNQFIGGDPNNGLGLFLRGQTSREGTCNSCHTAPPGPGSNNLIVQLPLISEPFKTPQLRNIYQRLLYNTEPLSISIDGFGLTHNGKSGTLSDFITTSFPLITSPADVRDIAAFLICFDTGTAPATGYARTIYRQNLGNAAIRDDWNTLQARAALNEIDLVVHGSINGVPRGLLYDAASRLYRDPLGLIGPFTQAQLTGFAGGNDTLTVMGVPPGSGLGMAQRRR